MPAKHRDQSDIPDPKEMPAEQYRQVRGLIEKTAKELLEGL